MKTLARAPVRLNDAETIQLGDALEIEFGDRVVRFDRGSALLWDPKQKALLVLDGIRKGRKVPSSGRGTARASLYRKWARRGVESEQSADVPSMGTWVSLGRVARIDYASDKWGRKRHGYTHDSGPGVRLYRFGGRRAPWVWVVKGGRMTVTARGIVQ